jgi:nicotinamide mononucleotide adenylyltransferase
MPHVRVGVAHGRFQVFHLDHLRYVTAARERCEHLVIGVTSPEVNALVKVEADDNRGDPEQNPLSYYERQRMIAWVLAEAQWDLSGISIVPFPIETPSKLVNYAPTDGRYFLTIYDAWGEEKARRLEDLGLDVEVLWRTDDKGISGTDVRAAIRDGNPVDHLVPPATLAAVESFELRERLLATRPPT